MKTCELEGAQLDYWVAKAEGHHPSIMTGVCVLYEKSGDKKRDELLRCKEFKPHANWSQGGAIIEREKMCVVYVCCNGWVAGCASMVNEDRHDIEDRGGFDNAMCGATPLLAAMRCYVANKFGEEVTDESTAGSADT